MIILLSASIGINLRMRVYVCGDVCRECLPLIIEHHRAVLECAEISVFSVAPVCVDDELLPNISPRILQLDLGVGGGVLSVGTSQIDVQALPTRAVLQIEARAIGVLEPLEEVDL